MVTTSFDGVDLDPAARAGLIVAHCPAYSRQAVVEHVFALPPDLVSRTAGPSGRRARWTTWSSPRAPTGTRTRPGRPTSRRSTATSRAISPDARATCSPGRARGEVRREDTGDA
ncbi:hypothetical protein [Streptomyces sp. NPDC003480]